ncbi:uncharacterized protein EAF02_004457 [Botrytis sinoallii]|uniref:uncharacterized protein n=1 Tax=Botrytis sinoallii TaxID=1463999 RepID=UPI0019029221|nr:uncharacterized protein EAF02_004457 [Botrytis sinoallii]KAF7885948.1 hypothetical protein EAF02_004457 [Botrytis sinoallii]
MFCNDTRAPSSEYFVEEQLHMQLTSYAPDRLDSYGPEVNLNLDIGHPTVLTPLSMFLSQLKASR